MNLNGPKDYEEIILKWIVFTCISNRAIPEENFYRIFVKTYIVHKNQICFKISGSGREDVLLIQYSLVKYVISDSYEVIAGTSFLPELCNFAL